MEKCTYCVQRINAANRLRESDTPGPATARIKTAASSLPRGRVIVFRKPERLRHRRAGSCAEARNYALLAELNTRPANDYLAAIRTDPEIRVRG
jgi:molybdopterin-containing oxidoreductase family iron-sulfur binding subunit